jgi:hypothetical protein
MNQIYERWQKGEAVRQKYPRYHSIKQRKAYQKVSYKKIKEKIFALLVERPCVDCGETDPIVLEFDHVTGKKDRSITKLVSDKSSWKKIQDEIDKCEVRCRNCHRKRHAEEDQHKRHEMYRAWMKLS